MYYDWHYNSAWYFLITYQSTITGDFLSITCGVNVSHSGHQSTNGTWEKMGPIFITLFLVTLSICVYNSMCSNYVIRCFSDIQKTMTCIYAIMFIVCAKVSMHSIFLDQVRHRQKYLNPGWVEFRVHSTSVLSHPWTKNINCQASAYLTNTDDLTLWSSPKCQRGW